MSLSQPEGCGLRPIRRDDAASVAALLDADEQVFGARSRLGAADVVAWWARADLELDSWLLEQDGRAAALGWVEDHEDLMLGFGCVHPDAKGRRLGSWLADRSEARAREKGRRAIRQFATASDAAARTLFESRGYREVRRFYELTIELGGELPEPELPEGLSIDTFRPEDARAWHAAASEAFEEEWGFDPLSFDEWWELRSKAPDFDPTVWFLVRDGGEIAALARCDAGRRGGGSVGMLGVRRPWRRRGLGLALLRHAFREFRRRGYERVSLGVDAQNPTGATRLYERAGMSVDAEYVTFERELQ